MADSPFSAFIVAFYHETARRVTFGFLRAGSQRQLDLAAANFPA
jgi:hypothetical protein